MIINIPVAYGELIDKLTILKIKLKMIKDNKKLGYIRSERNKLLYIYEKKKSFLDEDTIRILYNLEKNLYNINLKQWDIEDSIRDKERDKKFDKEFIEFARSAYKTNDKRMEIKNTINKLMSSDIIEQKSYKPY